MNEITTNWLARLRSGMYEQGKGFLHDLETDTWCCLGVLAEVGELEAKMEYSDGKMRVQNSCTKLDDTWFAETTGLPTTMQNTLAQMNDNNVPFADIADNIEWVLATSPTSATMETTTWGPDGSFAFSTINSIKKYLVHLVQQRDNAKKRLSDNECYLAELAVRIAVVNEAMANIQDAINKIKDENDWITYDNNAIKEIPPFEIF